jgi:(E)-4-hydroxy-3-methylbut-2-enyl-diphosphate synthase
LSGYETPLVADIHFTPNAAEIAARIVEKVRVNPGNYIDKKKFDFIQYTDAEYAEEIYRIRDRFTPLVRICKEYGTAMRIGTNHGSLSDRIMSRYGDSPIGMVESAMEFLRIARDENYHQIILSMKSSNPLVMVQAYRLLVESMNEEFNECYPLHLGVTEAGDGEDGRIKSAIGIGSLLEDGIGDTIRVSLTEDPEFEIPVCKDIVKQYTNRSGHQAIQPIITEPKIVLPYSPFNYMRRSTNNVLNIGSHNVPVVVADFSKKTEYTYDDMLAIGYAYDAQSDKWNISDGAADYIYVGHNEISIALPGTLSIIYDAGAKGQIQDLVRCYALYTTSEYLQNTDAIQGLHFVAVDADSNWDILQQLLAKTKQDVDVVFCVSSENAHTMPSMRRLIVEMGVQQIHCPVILQVHSHEAALDEQLIQFATRAGGLLLDGMGDGIWLSHDVHAVKNTQVTGRTYLQMNNNQQFLNNTSFSILQATRTRISKTEYISCPSCGRTLFDLQETTSKIRNATYHLKGVKIAIMGCIVNGPGEMADADFGYVGSGPGKITLYKGKEVVKKNVNSEIAVNELIQLLKDSEVWIEPAKA